MGTTNKLHPGEHARNTGRTGEFSLVLATQPGRMDWSYALQEQVVPESVAVAACGVKLLERRRARLPGEAQRSSAESPAALHAGWHPEARVNWACPLCSSSNVRAQAISQSSPWRLLLSPNARSWGCEMVGGSIRRIWGRSS